MFALAGLDFDVDVEQGDGGGGDAGKTRGLTDGLRTQTGELLLHLAREAADGGVVEPFGDGFGLGFLEALDGLLLLLEVAGVLDFGFDRLEFDPDGARGAVRFGMARLSLATFANCGRCGPPGVEARRRAGVDDRRGRRTRGRAGGRRG